MSTCNSKNNSRVIIILDEGIISQVQTSDPNIRVDIIDLDRNYADSELCDKVYDKVSNEPGLQDCTNYSLHTPGYD